MAVVLQYLSSLFTKLVRVHAWETFFLINYYKPCPFQNTVEKPETKTWKRMLGYFKDAFSEYQLELTTCI